jgi:hypothetical protein
MRIVCVLPSFVWFRSPRHPAFDPGDTTLKPHAWTLKFVWRVPDYTDFGKKLIYSVKTRDFGPFQGFPDDPQTF